MIALISSALFLGVIGAFIPIAAWMSKKALDQGLRVERLDFYLETVVVQTLLVALALWASRSNELLIGIAPGGGLEGAAWAAGLFFTAVIALVLGWRYSTPERRARLEMIVPHTRQERIAWVGVSLTAGGAEEIIYRGALFGMIAAWTGEFWIAAIIAAVVFAFAHLVQGWVAVVIVFVYGLAFQLLASATGSLLAPIVVHFLYDLVAGLVIGHWSRGGDDETL